MGDDSALKLAGGQEGCCWGAPALLSRGAGSRWLITTIRSEGEQLIARPRCKVSALQLAEEQQTGSRLLIKTLSRDPA